MFDRGFSAWGLKDLLDFGEELFPGPGPPTFRAQNSPLHYYSGAQTDYKVMLN